MIPSRTLIALVCSFALASVSHGHTISTDWIERLTGERIVSRTHSVKPPPPVGDPRNFERTFLTVPEWYIVYSAQEYGTFVTGKGLPSSYPYFSSVLQYKDIEKSAIAAAGGWGKADATTQTVLRTIRMSYVFEMYSIGLYENTVGRLFELLNGNFETREDAYVATIAQEYGAFLNHTPWYAFPYGTALIGLWSDTRSSSFTLRGMERRFAFTIGYGLKFIYASLIGYASNSAYGGAALTTDIIVDSKYTNALLPIPHITVHTSEDTVHILAPRYRALRDILFEFAARDITIQTIQGHSHILLTIVHTPQKNDCVKDVLQEHTTAHVQFAYPVLIGRQHSYRTFFAHTESGSDAYYAKENFGAQTVRTAILVETKQLGDFMYTLFSRCGIYTEHVYDY